MSLNKIKIKTLIKSNNELIEYETYANLINSVVSYEEKDGTYVYLDLDKDELIRENKQMLMRYSFIKNKKTKGIITIKDISRDLEVDIKTKNIIKDNKKYYIEYEIEDDFFIYELDFMEE